MSAQANKNQEATENLVRDLEKSLKTKDPTSGDLKANDRIIASVTDGIYREPWSAFRELVSNAYDADATEVKINCGYPFFNQIRISDDGNGMSPEVVADLLTNIGGSSKRTSRGKTLGTVNAKNPRQSPRGRSLIGKIGIGLFAVAQLTNQFQIITKRRGDSRRTSATVSINSFQEEKFADDADAYVSGQFEAIVEHADDIDSHGTSIVLLSIKSAIRAKLQSQAIWEAVAANQKDDDGLTSVVDPPKFHIGQVDRSNATLEAAPNLPWGKEQKSPEDKFEALFQAAVDNPGNVRAKSDLSHLDNYLQMLWRLSLSCPLPYIDGHPFDITGGHDFDFFEFSNKPKGGARELKIPKDKSIRQAMKFSTGAKNPRNKFEIYIDGVKLKRPVKFPQQIQGSQTLRRPLLFVGSMDTKDTGLQDTPEERTGGRLAFEAYFYWNSKIIPKESVGALIRVNEASGSLFDPEFLSYQISEQTRKKQITCEIFVTHGLDGAMNIDRESYNTSHPHFLFIQKWVHNAFRQFATQAKKLGKEIREEERATQQQKQADRITEHTTAAWEKMQGKNTALPTIEEKALASGEKAPVKVGGNEIVWDEGNDTAGRIPFPELVRPLVVILEAYGIWDEIDEKNRADLIMDIMSIFESKK